DQLRFLFFVQLQLVELTRKVVKQRTEIFAAVKGLAFDDVATDFQHERINKCRSEDAFIRTTLEMIDQVINEFSYAGESRYVSFGIARGANLVGINQKDRKSGVQGRGRE